MSKLPPLSEVDKDIVSHGTTELKFNKCQHELELVTGTEARCKKCGAGYLGPDIYKLVEASRLQTSK